MEVVITDKGSEYLDRIGNSVSAGPSPRSDKQYDWMVLAYLQREGYLDIVEDLEGERIIHPETHEAFRRPYRRLFEAGYIEEVR